MSLETPVLLLAWRRPETTKRVIGAIRAAAPSRVFVACDGPNAARPGENEDVTTTRKVIEHEIDWACRVERRYSDENQGCRIGVSSAITWFFDQVEEGIILEDDCVPHPDFFVYCRDLLERYRDDARVWGISGNNFQEGNWRGDGSYYFSRYSHIWGWATWRRCWHHYDLELTEWPRLKASGLLETVFENTAEREYWTSIWTRLHRDQMPDTWDYQWLFTCLVNQGLTALPNRNLVSNIGFGEGATHTTSESKPVPLAPVTLLPLRHPSFVLRDTAADRLTFDHHFGGLARRHASRVASRTGLNVRLAWRKLKSVWSSSVVR